MKDFDEKEFIEYVTNNRTSQRELVKKFNLSNRDMAIKLLKQYNLKIIPFTEEERRKKISESWEKRRVNVDPEEVREYCKNNRTSQRDLVKIFGFRSRGGLIGFLNRHNISYTPYSQKERNKIVSETWKNKSEEEIIEIETKRKKTMNILYGVDYPFENKHILNKFKQNFINKHGVYNPFQLDEVTKKRKRTMIKKYGTEHSWQSPEIRKKIKQTNIEKYGVEYPIQNPEIAKKAWESSQETLRALGKDGSKPEIEIREIIEYIGYYNEKKLIKEYDDDGKYIRNWEVDIYLPTLSKGIEFNGNFFHDKDNWEKHNVLTECTWEQCKEHYKTIQAEKHNFTLYHIWEDEWNELDSFENKVSYLSDLLELY